MGSYTIFIVVLVGFMRYERGEKIGKAIYLVLYDSLRVALKIGADLKVIFWKIEKNCVSFFAFVPYISCTQVKKK